MGNLIFLGVVKAWESHITRRDQQQTSGVCFTNVSWAIQNDFTKIHNDGNHIDGEIFKLKFWYSGQSHFLLKSICTDEY